MNRDEHQPLRVSFAYDGDRLFLAWSGVAPDQSLYSTTFDGTRWCEQRNYWGTGSSDVPGIVLYP